ncbi:Thiol:disulfide interchange protein DsbD precursor [Phycisphaerae bacterium RAS1]|nr:Thiol:disulfide interchange protein DsbD precursor [Phycisphaerae bacterium RAS1]
MFAAVLLPILTLLQPAPASAAPKITARLIAAHEVIAPGTRADLAIEISIEKHWHMYHPIQLSAGAPTLVSFEATPGATFGPIAFPVPELGVFEGFEYLGFADKLILLTSVELAANADASKPVQIRARVEGIACANEKGCVPVELSPTLSLPVKSELGPPVNADVFKKARDALPPPIAKAPYLEGSRIEISKRKLGLNDTAELVATIKVKSGHHVQDRDPGSKELIASRLYIESLDGVKVGEQRWPKAQIHQTKVFGTVREQAGEFKVTAPISISDEKFPAGPVDLRVLFSYQCCNDRGECYAPETAEAIVRFEAETPGAAGASPTGTVIPVVTHSDDPIANPTVASAGDDGATASGGAGESGGAAATRFNQIIDVSGQAAGGAMSLWWVFLSALLGGAILNIMPCVLPVLSLKIFSFMQQAQDEPGRILRMGLVYAAGILASFAVLAVFMVTGKTAWGSLMQKPEYIIGLIAAVFAFGLSLLGVFELRLPGVVENVAGAATTREGYGGAFLNGIMATALATPCVGPFLGSAVGVLVQLPPLVAGAGIMMVGVGLAAPYVLLTAFPKWLRYVPRPGKWMVTFKQIMGFVLLATIVWLLTILKEMVPAATLISTIAFLGFVGVACWAIGKVTLSDSAVRSVSIHAASAAVLAAGWWVSFRWLSEPASSQIVWYDWRPGLDQDLSRDGYTVYVDFTAAWCLTCQTNKKLVLHSEPIENRFARDKIIALKADFTKKDAAILAQLREFGKNGVPLNIVVPAGKPETAIVLPEVLTSGVVSDALRRAGASSADPPPPRLKQAAPAATVARR